MLLISLNFFNIFKDDLVRSQLPWHMLGNDSQIVFYFTAIRTLEGRRLFYFGDDSLSSPKIKSIDD